MRRLAVLLALLSAVADAAPTDLRAPRNSDGKEFLHPGISYTQGDLDRMKAMVEAGREPWKRCYDALARSRWASPDVFARGRGPGLGSFNNTIGFDGRHARDLPAARTKAKAALGTLEIPAGASVIRFVVRKAAYGFKPLGVTFE